MDTRIMKQVIFEKKILQWKQFPKKFLKYSERCFLKYFWSTLSGARFHLLVENEQ